jgi:hypothetical protein
MAHHRTPPAGLMAAGLLALLAIAGIAYGLWSKVLIIDGTVETGDLRVDWDFETCSELHGWPGPGFDDGEYLGKDVGRVTARIDPEDNQVINFQVENSYPSYVADCEVEWANTGTIPVNVSGFAIIPGDGLTNCTQAGNNRRTMSCDELTVIFVGSSGLHVDPGDGAASSLRIHVEQPAVQGAEYAFGVAVCAAQWNEAATFGECMANPSVEGPVGLLP